MTQARRIILNVLATYGRSAITLVLGLYTTKWVLAALGKDDFGIYGVVGSVVFFITFINAILQQSVCRFYAYSIGHGRTTSANEASVDLRCWFNTALTIHLILPFLAIVVGVPVGVCAIENCLNIPDVRMAASICVFGLSMVTVVSSMASVPYVAMFTACQYITELAVFDLFRAIALFSSAYCLRYVPGDKLIAYSIFMTAIPVGTQIAQVIRARCKFDACRISWSMMFSRDRLLRIGAFSSMRFVQGLGWTVRGHGSAVLSNVVFGPASNAAINVATQLSGQTASLSGSLMNAFNPAITSAVGSGDMTLARSMAYRCCKFGSCLVVAIGIPLVFAMEEWVSIWLSAPPPNSAILCQCMIFGFMIDYMTMGHNLMISAVGKIVGWQLSEGACFVLALPIGGAFIWFGLGVASIGYAYLFSVVLIMVVRLYYASKYCGMAVGSWLARVLTPIVSICVLMSLSWILSFFALKESFPMTCKYMASAFSGVGLIVFSWPILFTREEREFVVSRVSGMKRRLCGK